MASTRNPFIVRGGDSSTGVNRTAATVREAVRMAKTASRGGKFVCVVGPRMEPSPWDETQSSFNAQATLGCFFDGKRSTLTLPREHQRYFREQNKRRK